MQFSRIRPVSSKKGCRQEQNGEHRSLHDVVLRLLESIGHGAKHVCHLRRTPIIVVIAIVTVIITITLRMITLTNKNS